jgi:hypothetical protein
MWQGPGAYWVPAGSTGTRPLVTVLSSRTLPMIRFEVTDRVRLSTTGCPCSLRPTLPGSQPAPLPQHARDQRRCRHGPAPESGASPLLRAGVVQCGQPTPVLLLVEVTFEHVPWNAPYYRRCGFRVLDEREWTPGLRAIREREAVHGLDRWPRVCMRKDLSAGA